MDGVNVELTIQSHSDCCVHEAFAQQVASTPDAIAVLDQRTRTTYSELYARVQTLALVLRSAGVSRDVAVPLLAERGVDSVIAILGILQSGGAYVPINPLEPDERVNAILSDTRSPVAVATERFRERLENHQIHVVVPDDEPETMLSARLAPSSVPDDLATVIYTSGTTGTPRGVEIPHRTIMWRVKTGYPLLRNDVQKAPLNVAAHFSDLLVPLLCGGPVIFAPSSTFGSGHALLDLVRNHGPRRMVFVPSQLRILLESGGAAVDALGKLESVVVSGEPVTPALVELFQRLLPRVLLFNAYGTSELARFACMGEVSSPDDITVGTPFSGCNLYILDEKLQIVPPQVVGEIYVGSTELARGYRSDPEATRQHFLPDPFAANGSRMYKTGDLGERLPDGRVRLIGRRDFEVKVHGYRGNLTAVESVIEQVPGVRRSVATFDNATQRITAHVQPIIPGAVDTMRVRKAVAAQMPPYMVPGRIRFVETLPLLLNGKVDRCALAVEASDVIAERTEPGDLPGTSTGTEWLIADLWKEVLNVPHVDLTDDFFALGGDSLAALRFMLRAEECGLAVTAQQLEDASSLAALARSLDGRNQPDKTA